MDRSEELKAIEARLSAPLPDSPNPSVLVSEFARIESELAELLRIETDLDVWDVELYRLGQGGFVAYVETMDDARQLASWIKNNLPELSPTTGNDEDGSPYVAAPRGKTK